MSKQKYTYDYINRQIYMLEAVAAYRNLREDEQKELDRFKKLLEYPIDNSECLNAINLINIKLDKIMILLEEIKKE